MSMSWYLRMVDLHLVHLLKLLIPDRNYLSLPVVSVLLLMQHMLLLMNLLQVM